MPEEPVIAKNVEETTTTQDANEEAAAHDSGVASLLIALGGLALVFAAKGLDDWAEAIQARGGHFHVPIHYTAYGVEHLGVVLIVAMIARKVIEEATERRMARAFNAILKREIEKTSQEFAVKSLAPLETKINTLVTNLSYRIASLSEGPLQEELMKSVLNPDFVRPAYLLYLGLKPLVCEEAESRDLLEATIRLQYQVKNLNKSAIPYSIFSWIDDVIRLSSLQTHFTHIWWGTDKEKLITGDIRELELKGQIERGDGVVVSKVSTGDIPAGGLLYVDVEAVQLMRTEDHFVWNLAGLTQRMDVEVELGGGLTRENFCLYPREMHHIKHEAFRKTEKWTGNTLHISVNEILLPFQGVEIRWAPQQKMVPIETLAATQIPTQPQIKQ